MNLGAWRNMSRRSGGGIRLVTTLARDTGSNPVAPTNFASGPFGFFNPDPLRYLLGLSARCISFGSHGNRHVGRSRWATNFLRLISLAWPDTRETPAVRTSF